MLHRSKGIKSTCDRLMLRLTLLLFTCSPLSALANNNLSYSDLRPMDVILADFLAKPDPQSLSYASIRCAALTATIAAYFDNGMDPKAKQQAETLMKYGETFVSIAGRLAKNGLTITDEVTNEIDGWISESLETQSKIIIDRLNLNSIRHGSGFAKDPEVNRDLEACSNLYFIMKASAESNPQ